MLNRRFHIVVPQNNYGEQERKMVLDEWFRISFSNPKEHSK